MFSLSLRSSTLKSLIRSVNTISTAPQNCTFYMSPIACLTPFLAYQFCNAKSIPWSELLVKDCTRAKLLPLSLHSLYNEHHTLTNCTDFPLDFVVIFLLASCLCELLFLSSLWGNIIGLKRGMKWCCFLLRSSSGKWATFVKLSLCCQTSISHSEASEPWACLLPAIML
jgi:hypothetical protein